MKYSFSLFVFTVTFLPLYAQKPQTVHQHTIETNYLLYLPDAYAKDNQNWPLVIFLHGAGERGDDIELVKKHGPPKLVSKDSSFAFILASPQCPAGQWWDTDVIKKLIDDLVENYRVDRNRIYLTGLSMGGYGTWDIAARYPNIFAAIAPICGGGNPAYAWRLRHMPTWVFHGEKDKVVPLWESQRMVEALKPYNSQIKFTIYPEAGHDSWTDTYLDPAFYKWLLAQQRYQRPSSLPTDKMKSFEGIYKDDHGTVYTVSKNNNKLWLSIDGYSSTSLIQESESTFYLSRGNMLLSFEAVENQDTYILYLHADEGVKVAKGNTEK